MDLIIPYNNIENIISIKYATNIISNYPTWNSQIIYGKSTSKNPIIVQYNSKLYKSLTNFNTTNPSTSATNWKYISDIQYPTAVAWTSTSTAGVGDIVYYNGLYFKAITASAVPPPTTPTSSGPWEFIGYTNSHSLLQSSAVGNTKLFSGGSIVRFDRLKEYNNISFLGLKNVNSIEIVEKDALNPTYLSSGTYVGFNVPEDRTTYRWQSVAYSESLDLLLYVGYRISDNKLTIRYTTNLSQQTDTFKNIVETGPFTTITVESKLYESSDYSPTIPNKVYWSEIFQAFYIVGSTASGNINILKSSNGIAWTSCQLAYSNQIGGASIRNFSGIALGTGMVDIIDGNNELFAISKQGIWTSLDGNNWIETYLESGRTFHNIAYVPKTSSQTGFLAVVGDTGQPTEGYIWIFSTSNNYQSVTNVYQVARQYTLSVLYNSRLDELLVGGVPGIIKVMVGASTKTSAEFSSNLVSWVNNTLTISGVTNPCAILLTNSLHYGVIANVKEQSNFQGLTYITHTIEDINGSTVNGFTRISEVKVLYQFNYQPLIPRVCIPIDRLGTFFTLINSTIINIIHGLILYDENILNRYRYTIDIENNQEILNVLNTFTSTKNTKLYIYFNLEDDVDYGSIGNVLVGIKETIGTTQNDMSVGIVDYSKKDTDEFGNIIFVERPYSQRINTNIIIRDTKIYEIYEKLVSIRTTPCIWIPVANNLDYSFLTVLGFYKEFSVDINYPEYALCSLSIESLANF